MKQRKIVLFSLLCLLSLARANAQTEQVETASHKNAIGLKIGYEQSYMKDLNFSPLGYVVRGKNLGLEYWRTSKKEDLKFFKIDFAMDTLRVGIPPAISSDRYLANVEFGYLKQLGISTEKISLYLGGQYHTYLDLAFYEGSGAVTFFVLHGIDIVGLAAYKINSRHRLYTSLALPIFGLLSRPPYTGWDKFIIESQDNVARIFFRGKWGSINQYMAVNWITTYHYNLSSRWDLTAQYRFRYYRSSHVNLAKVATNQFALGVYLKF